MRFDPHRTRRHWLWLAVCFVPAVWTCADDKPAVIVNSVTTEVGPGTPVQTAQVSAPNGIASPGGTTTSVAQPVKTESSKPAVFDERSARSTAVALNYCRASFHRLRQNPSRRVWYEEQQHILNNLNLNEIADQEVIALYTAVLDEVSKERIAEKERKVLHDNYKHQVRRQVLSTAFVMGAEVTTAQYVNAARTGANSWWDYRAVGQTRDLDLWKVEKTRLTEVSDKSNKFLNTFWDLAKKKQIPDEWLIRGNNLDELDVALAETDPAVRLRVLKRMEPVMVCYPPYYYHLGRTQQAQGLWVPASDTFHKLVQLGHGHFRSDDMLAAGLANLAIIQAHLKNPDATLTAQRALKYANGAWQVNLVCARILQQTGLSDEAEEAILRNVDVDLERPQSLASLLSLYSQSGNEQKLMLALNDPEIVAELPALSLLQSAGKLGVRRMPPFAMRQLVTSLYVYERASFGRSQLVCTAAPAWGLDGAQAVLIGQTPERPDSRGISNQGQTQLSFRTEGMVQYSPAGEPELVMEITYADGQPVRLHLKPQAWSQEMFDHVEHQPGRAVEVRELLPRLTQTRPRWNFVVTEAEFGKTKVALWDRSAPGEPGKQQLLVDQKRAPGGTAGAQPSTGTKATTVVIDSVTPVPSVIQDLTRPATSKPAKDAPGKPQTESKPPTETAKPPNLGFRPAKLPTRSRVQLSEDLESIDEDEDEF